MDNKRFMARLNKMGACYDARTWTQEHGGDVETLWRDCERGDWMAWYISKKSKGDSARRKLVGALADCAALSLKYYEAKYPKDKRVRNTIKVCRAYARGEATREELRAYAADAAAAAAAAAYAAAYAAAAAAYAAADAAYAAADAAARKKTLKKCAAIFRKHYPTPL